MKLAVKPHCKEPLTYNLRTTPTVEELHSVAGYQCFCNVWFASQQREHQQRGYNTHLTTALD